MVVTGIYYLAAGKRYCWLKSEESNCAALFSLSLVSLRRKLFLLSGLTPNLDNVWEDSTTDPGSIAIGILSGFWAFGGWNYLNFLTGELQRPERLIALDIYLVGLSVHPSFHPTV